MWRPLSWILEAIGAVRLNVSLGRVLPSVGHVSGVDAHGDEGFVLFANARALYDVWAPAAGSPFEPYHCVTLFAVLDESLPGGAPRPPRAEDVARFETEPVLQPSEELLELIWLTQGTLVIVDLEGPSSVALGARLIQRGCQPVCTFDNWPHPRGVGKPEETLAQLLRHAPVVALARPALSVASPAVWLCDRTRLEGRAPPPGHFDNRYFLDDTVLPGTTVLRATGVSRIVLIQPSRQAAVQPDIDAWLHDRSKEGFEVLITDVSDQHLDPRPHKPMRTYFPSIGSRSNADGFGALVPEPSSSGG